MPIKITPVSNVDNLYIIPYERKSESQELCLRFEIEHITLSTYECIRAFLKEKKMRSKDFGYIITDKFNPEYKNIESYKVQNGKDDCIIHSIKI